MISRWRSIWRERQDQVPAPSSTPLSSSRAEEGEGVQTVGVGAVAVVGGDVDDDHVGEAEEVVDGDGTRLLPAHLQLLLRVRVFNPTNIKPVPIPFPFCEGSEQLSRRMEQLWESSG